MLPLSSAKVMGAGLRAAGGCAWGGPDGEVCMSVAARAQRVGDALVGGGIASSMRAATACCSSSMSMMEQGDMVNWRELDEDDLDIWKDEL